jgi:hypothetical protein
MQMPIILDIANEQSFSLLSSPQPPPPQILILARVSLMPLHYEEKSCNFILSENYFASVVH